MPQRLMNMTPLTIDFKPIVNGVQQEYKGMQFDTAPMFQSLTEHENRRVSANKDYEGINLKLGDLKSKLYNDADTEQYIANISNDITNQIQEQIDAGNYGRAITLSSQLGGNLLNRQDVIDRIKANEDYSKLVALNEQRTATGKVKQSALEWWKNTQGKYKYNARLDEEGNELGGSLANIPTLYDSLNMNDVAKSVFDLIKPDTKQTSKTIGSDTGGYNSVEVTRGGFEDTKSNSRTVVTRDDIEKVLTEYFRDIEHYNQALQEFNVLLYQLSKLENSNDPNDREAYNAYISGIDYKNDDNKESKLVFKNGVPSFKEFMIQNIINSDYVKALPYVIDNTSTGHKSTDIKSPISNTSEERGSGKEGDENNNGSSNGNQSTVHGNSTKQYRVGQGPLKVNMQD